MRKTICRLPLEILCIVFACIIFLTGCVTTSYYVSPMYGSSTPYYTLPLHKDSIKSSLYANGTFTVGSVNHDGHDNVFSFSGNVYNNHQFNIFNAWYGAGITLGNYSVNRYDSNTYRPQFDTAIVNRLGGNKFFGSYNINGGVNVVLPFKNGGEWRVLAITGSLQNEFGKYLEFRKELNDSSVNAVVKSGVLGTLGFSTEIVIKAGNNSVLGFSLGGTLLLGSGYKNKNNNDIYAAPERYSYTSLGWNFTYDRYSFFMIGNFGTRMSNMQIGMNYRVNKFSKNRRSQPAQ